MRTILFWTLLLTSFGGSTPSFASDTLDTLIKQKAEEFLRKGIAAYQNKNYLDAAKFYKRSNRFAKSLRATSNLCNLYLYGQGVAKNVEQARKLCEYSAKYDDAHALAMLGEIYLFGRGVTKDMAKAVGYYERASQLGHGHSKFVLALLIMKTQPDKAKKLLEEADKAGHGHAKKALQDLAKQK